MSRAIVVAKVTVLVVVVLLAAYLVFAATIGSDIHGSRLVPASPSAVSLFHGCENMNGSPITGTNGGPNPCP
jgi:hypothetical protein